MPDGTRRSRLRWESHDKGATTMNENTDTNTSTDMTAEAYRLSLGLPTELSLIHI